MGNKKYENIKSLLNSLIFATIIGRGEHMTNSNEGIVSLKTKVDKLYKVIDEIEPEQVDLTEIDRIIEMVSDLEETCKQLKE
jgi:hypothetical protein